MKGREGKGPPSTDLLVCFPSRAHLTLMPKPICSPARPSESSKRQHSHANHLHHPHHRHLKKFSNRNGVPSQASPLLWAKTKPISKDISEPTSPKVTCSGQIKVRSKPASSCKNWQSVMEEIERLHNNRKHKKKSAWVEALGLKKDVMQFLTCLRNIRFDFRCFGSFSTSGITSDDDEDDEDEEEDYQEPGRISRETINDENETSRTVFSKWFMVLQENNNNNNNDLMIKKEKQKSKNEESIEAPPPNALLLMRCRSAPVKSWIQERQEVEEDEEEESNCNDDEDFEKQKEECVKKEKEAMEEEKRKKENLVAMRYGTDFYKFSSDIAKETWVVGGIRDTLTRSRSWKR